MNDTMQILGSGLVTQKYHKPRTHRTHLLGPPASAPRRAPPPQAQQPGSYGSWRVSNQLHGFGTGYAKQP